MKKTIVSLLCVTMMLLALCVPFTAMAEETAEGVEVTIGSVEAAQGDEIDVPITIDKNPGIWGINWKVYYDTQVLRFDGIEFKDEFAALGLLDTNEVKYPVVLNGMGAQLEDETTTGVIAVIHFKVFVGAKLGDTEISMMAETGNNINVDAEDVPLTVNKGKIKVTEGLAESDDKEDYPPEKPLEENKPQNQPVGYSTKSSEGGHKWIWIIIGAVALLAVVVVIWLFSGSDEEKAPETATAPEGEPSADDAAFLKMLADADAAKAEQSAESEKTEE